ncbi:MAG TPA: hypothetical protein VKT82_03190 [Ktedonobacterales bacterium]|nr:hypothetical protein [Ktedonobacterales bacterium]
MMQLQGISPATYETMTSKITTDGMGTVAQMTDAMGGVTQYQHDVNENIIKVTDPDGHVTTGTFDSNGNILAQVVDPRGLNLTTTWTYDADNNVLTETDPRGIVTQYAYDSQGDVLTTVANYQSGVQPDSQANVETSATYDVLGEKLTQANPLVIVTQYGYDLLGHPLQTVADYRSGVQPDSQTAFRAGVLGHVASEGIGIQVDGDMSSFRALGAQSLRSACHIDHYRLLGRGQVSHVLPKGLGAGDLPFGWRSVLDRDTRYPTQL